MTRYISINWMFGRPATGADQDEDRARRAAEAVLDAASADYAAAQAEYCRQFVEFDDEAPMSGMARLWCDARSAADAALTEGWHNPNGAACEISA